MKKNIVLFAFLIAVVNLSTANPPLTLRSLQSSDDIIVRTVLDEVKLSADKSDMLVKIDEKLFRIERSGETITSQSLAGSYMVKLNQLYEVSDLSLPLLRNSHSFEIGNYSCLNFTITSTAIPQDVVEGS